MGAYTCTAGETILPFPIAAGKGWLLIVEFGYRGIACQGEND